MAEAIFEHEAQVRAALHAIASDPAHGAAALSSPHVMGNLLKDFLPDAPRESGLLIAAAQAGVSEKLRQHAAHGLDANTAITLVARSLGDSTAFGEQACSWAAREMAIALGLVDADHPGGSGATPDGADTTQSPGIPAGEAETIKPVPATPVSDAGTILGADAPAAAAETLQAAPAGAKPGSGRNAGRVILLIAGGLVVVIGIVVGVVVASNGDSGKPLTFNQLRVGDCLSGDGLNFTQALPTTYFALPCGQQHVAQVFYRNLGFWPSSKAWPGFNAIEHQGTVGCDNALTAYDGISNANKSIYSLAFTNPSSSSWQSGDRSLVCIAYMSTSADPGGAPVTGSIQNSDQ
jgi:hypothetical protein